MVREQMKKNLRERVIKTLKSQGFSVNPHVRPMCDSKETLRQIQRTARWEKLRKHKTFLAHELAEVKGFLRDGVDIDPARIGLELREVNRDSFEERVFRFWNLVWWSIPYERAYGRQMRFIIWDTTHDSPFGLIGLHSAPLRMLVRDEWLGITKDRRDWWVNMSMSAQRVGALPPYNELIGGKMVALTLASQEIRECYREKYKNRRTIISKRYLPAELLFITTTGAFGKSSIYNRLKYKGQTIVEFLGYTQGSGAFHIPEDLYFDLLIFLENEGVDVSRGYGHGPSRKRQLLSRAFRSLGFPPFEYHGIRRAFYLIAFARNLKDVIQKDKQPVLKKLRFDEMADFWKERWAIPRAKRRPRWKDFKADSFMDEAGKMLSEVD